MKPLAVLPVLWLACASTALGAEKLPPLDAEFLEYLATFGGDEEDWALFADEDDPPAEPPPAQDPVTPVAKREGSKPSAEAAEKR
jgi:hypothetical protein